MLKRVFVGLALLCAVGCKSPTSPDCTVLPRVEERQTVVVNGRLVFITVIAPTMTTCSS